jgi:3-phosphoshikimate 1-carboxyvinyltransferase
MKLLGQPQTTPLSGEITVPGDKSISHRAIMLASLAEGMSAIREWLPAGDTLATLAAFRALGVRIEIGRKTPQAWDLTIEGRGLHGLEPPERPLDCRNAGTCMRLMAGIMAGQRFPSVLDGSEQLRKRPMGRITGPLSRMGASIADNDGRAPLHIQPAPLYGVEYEMKVASAQVKSALLLAGIYAEGDTRIYQPGPARDHTERMLQAMGLQIEEAEDWISLRKGNGSAPLSLQPLDLTVPGDLSSAAFPLVAAAIVPHSKIRLNNIGFNKTRTGLLEILQGMGVQFTVEAVRTTGGEPTADLTIQFDEMHSTAVAGETVPRAIDEFPVWAVAATQAAGDSSVRDAAELRVKEVDRISLLAGEMRKLGAEISEQADGFTVHGPTRLEGGEVDSFGDHRLGMALAVAGLVARKETVVHDAGCIADSFPAFVETMRSLGANMEWIKE